MLGSRQQAITDVIAVNMYNYGFTPHVIVLCHLRKKILMFWYSYTLGEETVNKFLFFKRRFCRESYDIIAYFSIESVRHDQVVVLIGKSKCQGFRFPGKGDVEPLNEFASQSARFRIFLYRLPQERKGRRAKRPTWSS